MKLVDSFTFDQRVVINNIKGVVDFIGEEVVILINEDKQELINIREIQDVYALGYEYPDWIHFEVNSI